MVQDVDVPVEDPKRVSVEHLVHINVGCKTISDISHIPHLDKHVVLRKTVYILVDQSVIRASYRNIGSQKVSSTIMFRPRRKRSPSTVGHLMFLFSLG